MVLEDLEDLVEVEVVLADIPALNPSPDLIPAAETLTFPAYVSTVLYRTIPGILPSAILCRVLIEFDGLHL